MRFSRFLLAVCAACALTAIVSAQTIQINRDNKTIAINTSDEATAVADIAAVTVGYEVYGADSQSTYTDGGKLSHGILDALHKAGIDDKDIESTGQGLQRNTDFDDKETPEQRAKKQFVMRQSWQVSVAPKSAGEVIRLAVAAGANQSGAIEWRLADRKGLQAKAAAAALIKARAVASQMAEGMHVQLGALIYASNEAPRVAMFRHAGVVLNSSSASVSSDMRQRLPELEIRPQTVREEATVYAVFAID